jgi:predicted TIM-barrel fold metal-dependent hydrolase
MSWNLLVIAALLASTGCQDGATRPEKTRRPIIDSHVHIVPTEACLKRALKIFDAAGITRFCAKSAGFYPSARFQATVAMAKKLGPRFAFFANIDWRGIDDSDWPEREARRLSKEVALGARGVKIFKNLGLGVRTADGKLLAIDDARMDPLMKRAAELGAIVAMHTSDPLAFFTPPTPDNERYLELLFAPSWSFYGQDFPSRSELFAARERLIARHPETTFLLIHLANNPEDLAYVDRLLSAHPNVYVDTSARVGEIGRHPAEQVRAFFIKYQDRILFGSDIVIDPGGLQLGSLSIWPDDDSDAARFYAAHREYFETDHRRIDHPTPIQGDWKVDAINLPDEVIEKFYVKNAEKLIWKS